MCSMLEIYLEQFHLSWNNFIINSVNNSWRNSVTNSSGIYLKKISSNSIMIFRRKFKRIFRDFRKNAWRNPGRSRNRAKSDGEIPEGVPEGRSEGSPERIPEGILERTSLKDFRMELLEDSRVKIPGSIQKGTPSVISKQVEES